MPKIAIDFDPLTTKNFQHGNEATVRFLTKSPEFITFCGNINPKSSEMKDYIPIKTTGVLVISIHSRSCNFAQSCKYIYIDKKIDMHSLKKNFLFSFTLRITFKYNLMSIQIITITLKYSKIYNLAKGETLVYQDSISA